MNNSTENYINSGTKLNETKISGKISTILVYTAGLPSFFITFKRITLLFRNTLMTIQKSVNALRHPWSCCCWLLKSSRQHYCALPVFTLFLIYFYSFGLHHDGDGNSCVDGRYIMSSTLTSGTDAMRWSTCSQESLQTFLRYKSLFMVFYKLL